MKKLSLAFFVFCFHVLAFHTQADTTYLHIDSFLNQVIEHHPIAKTANLQQAIAKAQLLKAKGGFDPYIMGSVEQKQFDGKNYYQLINSGLKIPLWPGIDLKAGYENNDGVALNPENVIPNGGLMQAGVELPLLQGLIIDARRTAVRKAQNGLQIGDNEKLKMANDLLADAASTYWLWNLAWQEYLLYTKVLQIAELRFKAVKGLYYLGDNPAIDTLEAFIQMQNRVVASTEAFMKYTSLSYYLKYYIWNNEENNLWTEVYLPVDTFTFDVPIDTLNIRTRQPEIIGLDLKQNQLSLDYKLKKEMLKPSLKVKYNLLNNAVGIPAFNTQDYKWGATFAMPVFLRKERGDLRLANFYLMENELKRNQKMVEWNAKQKALYNDLNYLNIQLVLLTDITTNYLTLLNAEQTKLNAGESSLFVVNNREQMYVQASLKQLETKLKTNLTKVKIHHTLASWAQLK